MKPYDTVGPVTGEPLYRPLIIVEAVPPENPFLGTMVHSVENAIFAGYVAPHLTEMLADLRTVNFRILPPMSFGTPASQRGYVMGFLAHAESMTSRPSGLASAILATFADFVVRGWSPFRAATTIAACAQRSRMHAAFEMVQPILMPFLAMRRAYRLPLDPMLHLQEQLWRIITSTTA